ncbi:Phage Tail Collar Domain protein [compost metagenome]
MYRIDTVDAVPTQPDVGAVGTPGYYSDGNVTTGQRGTTLSAAHLNTMQEEIAAVPEYVGIALDKNDPHQLLKAIRQMVEGDRVGELFFWPAAGAPNGRALRCFGQAVSRTGETAALFAKLGTGYGAGDGSTTFNLPDPRKYFPRVWDDREARVIGSTQADQNKLHGHTASSGNAGGRPATQTDPAGAHDHTVASSAGIGQGSGSPDSVQQSGGSMTTSAAPNHQHGIPAVPDHNHTVTVDASGGDEARPMNIAWPLYIRY